MTSLMTIAPVPAKTRANLPIASAINRRIGFVPSRLTDRTQPLELYSPGRMWAEQRSEGLRTGLPQSLEQAAFFGAMLQPTKPNSDIAGKSPRNDRFEHGAQPARFDCEEIA